MRLIDAEKMKTRIALENMEVLVNAIKVWIDNQETVDAVEVVRCKDCLFFHRYGFKLEYTECKHFDYEVTEDGYCCWAERRENDTDEH